ncbi:NAD(P)/FAD-dependent oxidoreductase [Nitrincola alkalilacustris]|uniref:NAD(P)/FAD-dependent oxidoreductase n=1 Tax=Nitrincola alkalilacustris TaxID=1571224 RepID=UPI00124DE5D1|nr:FAD-binding oxidoreductase [Nitrincola alkalilacustris]
MQQAESLWSASAVEAAVGDPLQESMSADVVVVGGGFTGLSTALHLARQGVSVIVLEAQEIGHGGSGRNVGLANAGLWMEPDQMASKLGEGPGERLYHELAQAPDLVFSLIEQHQIACEPVRNGTLHLAHSGMGERELQRRWRQLNARGAPVTLLDRAQTRKRTGAEGYQAALFDPRAGTIQPLAYARGLARAAQEAGAIIATQTPVTALDRQAPSGWLLHTPSGTVAAAQVVLATNAYSGPLYPSLVQSFVPINFFQYASEPLSETQLARILPGREGTWDTRSIMNAFRLDQQGRFILGSMGDLLPADRLADWADNWITRSYPELGRLSWQHRWVGQIAFSQDHLPHFHELASGLYSCMGYSGRGIGPGTWMGRALAQYLCTGDTTVMPLPVTQPSRVPLRDLQAAFYEVAARTAHRFPRLS